MEKTTIKLNDSDIAYLSDAIRKGVLDGEAMPGHLLSELKRLFNVVEWDFDLLANEWDTLKLDDWDVDLSDWGEG